MTHTGLTGTKRCKKQRLIKTLTASAAFVFIAACPAYAQDVTFADILAAPDDTSLNLKYATEQAQAGNLLTAASSLERLLFYDPNWDEARLFYAVILYRLGDAKAAEYEIDLLEGRTLGPKAQVEYEKYSRLIKGHLNKTRFSGQVALGYSYDENVTGIFDEANVGGVEEDDTALNVRGRLRVSHVLSEAHALRLVGEVRAYSKFYETLDSNDYTVVAGGGGLEGANGPYAWGAGLKAKNVAIDGDTYLTEVGVGFQMKRPVNEKLSWTITGDYVDQDYDNVVIGTIPTIREDERSGIKYSAGIKLDHKFTARLKGGLGLGYEVKRADFKPYEYTGPIANVTLDAFLIKGIYIDLDYIYRDLEYADPDPFIIDLITNPASPEREDKRQYFRGAVGVPLSVFFKGDTAASRRRFETTKLEFSAFHDQRDSNYTIYEYENTGAELAFVWRFDK